MDTRTALIRRATIVLALSGVAILVLAVIQPTSFGVTTTVAVVLGVPTSLVNLVVAGRARRSADPHEIDDLAFVQTLVAASAAGVAVGAVADRAFAVLMAMSLIFVYSSLVLNGRRHTITAAVGMAVAATSAIVGGTLTPDNAAALLVAGVVAVLSGVGAELHDLQLRERDDALHQARRAARALEVAVTGIQRSATTDSRRIIEAITTAAARLAEGPSGVLLLQEDGRLQVGASRGLPAEVTSRRFEPHEGMIGRVFDAGETCTLNRDEDDQMTEVQHALGLHSVTGTPIRVNGVVVGALLAGRTHAEPWAHEELDAFTLLAEHAGRALELSQEAAADRRTMARLAELDRIKDDVVATVSHELRTPVTVIVGLGETLATHDHLDPTTRAELTQRLWANGVSLGQIVEQLFDAALIQRGELVPVRGPVRVRQLVEGTVTRLYPLLLHHTVRNQVAPSVVVDADQALLERVVENLLVNAVRHTPSGTTVTIEAPTVASDVHLAVFDDGPGIAPADLPHVIERFGRGGDLNERSRGMGIGLSLADDILRAHDSALGVTSRVGGGARFTFVLPAAPGRPVAGDPDHVLRQ